MQLTGKQIVERDILQNVCVNGIQQQGVEVRIDRGFVVQMSVPVSLMVDLRPMLWGHFSKLNFPLRSRRAPE